MSNFLLFSQKITVWSFVLFFAAGTHQILSASDRSSDRAGIPGVGAPVVDGRAGDDREPVRVKGLNNLGNTCFMNALVQSMYHCAPLNFLVSNAVAQDGQVLAPLALGLKEAFTGLSLEDGLNSYIPAAFVHAAWDLKEVAGYGMPRNLFARGAQDDSATLWSCIVDAFDRAGASLRYGQGLKPCSKIVCSRGHERFSHGDTLAGSVAKLELVVPDERDGDCQLQDLVDASREIEDLNEVKCLSCKREDIARGDRSNILKGRDAREILNPRSGRPKYRYAARKENSFLLDPAEEFLVLHLKRFGFDRIASKNKVNVVCPSKRVLLRDALGHQHEFEIVSVVVHYGDGIDGGHYYAISQYGLLNDSVVRRDSRIFDRLCTLGHYSCYCSFDEQYSDQGGNAYMYFLRRIGYIPAVREPDEVDAEPEVIAADPRTAPALQIQSVWRGKKARDIYQALRKNKEEEKQGIKIANWLSGIKKRQAFKKAVAEIKKAEDEIKKAKQREAIQQKQAARKIQKAFKSSQSFQQLMRDKDAEKKEFQSMISVINSKYYKLIHEFRLLDSVGFDLIGTLVVDGIKQEADKLATHRQALAALESRDELNSLVAQRALICEQFEKALLENMIKRIQELLQLVRKTLDDRLSDSIPKESDPHFKLYNLLQNQVSRQLRVWNDFVESLKLVERFDDLEAIPSVTELVTTCMACVDLYVFVYDSIMQLNRYKEYVLESVTEEAERDALSQKVTSTIDQVVAAGEGMFEDDFDFDQACKEIARVAEFALIAPAGLDLRSRMTDSKSEGIENPKSKKVTRLTRLDKKRNSVIKSLGADRAWGSPESRGKELEQESVLEGTNPFPRDYRLKPKKSASRQRKPLNLELQRAKPVTVKKLVGAPALVQPGVQPAAKKVVVVPAVEVDSAEVVAKRLPLRQAAIQDQWNLCLSNELKKTTKKREPQVRDALVELFKLRNFQVDDLTPMQWREVLAGYVQDVNGLKPNFMAGSQNQSHLRKLQAELAKTDAPHLDDDVLPDTGRAPEAESSEAQDSSTGGDTAVPVSKDVEEIIKNMEALTLAPGSWKNKSQTVTCFTQPAFAAAVDKTARVRSPEWAVMRDRLRKQWQIIEKLPLDNAKADSVRRNLKTIMGDLVG